MKNKRKWKRKYGRVYTIRDSTCQNTHQFARDEFEYHASSARWQLCLWWRLQWVNKGIAREESEMILARSVDTNLKRVGWQQRWSKAKEKILSLVSGWYFSHYKALANLTLTSHLCVLKTSVVVKHGVYLERWLCGLTVTLETMLVNTLLEKVRIILLVEAGFNHPSKEIFGKRMLDTVGKHGIVQERKLQQERQRARQQDTHQGYI